MKRSGKWYRNNEARVMNSLGLIPTKNSGSGWIEKEDGQSDDVICQLKSTDANSIRVNLSDLQTLEYNAAVSHKMPVFAVQFIQAGQVYLMMRPCDLEDLAGFLKTGENAAALRETYVDDQQISGQCVPHVNRSIKSSSAARKKFMSEQERKFEKGKKSAI